MKLALDTNAYSDFFRSIPSRVTIIRQAERIFLPFIVLGELRGGFALGRKESEIWMLSIGSCSPRGFRSCFRMMRAPGITPEFLLTSNGGDYPSRQTIFGSPHFPFNTI
jgi:hypothetical protein